MSLIRDTLSKGIEVIREDLLPLKYDLIKAGILKPDQSAYEQKANLTDPYNYGLFNWLCAVLRL